MAGTEDVQSVTSRVGDALPARLRAVVESAARHQTPVLAGGLAFFGLLSLSPAVGVGLGVLRLLAPDHLVNALVDSLQHSFPETLGLAGILEQMQDRAARYAGLGLVVLLWPATTLASGWRRALDAVGERETAPAMRGLAGRAKGLGIGLGLLAGILVLVAAMVAATAMIGRRGALIAAIAVAVVALQFGFTLLVYRFLPRESVPWSRLWPGAAWSTLGVCVATVALALALTVADQFAEQYPPALSTAVVLGLWLYGANLSLLLGAELNTVRQAP
ncbi:MAG TPA: YihY/virulence factor BrkB family protein [Egibacteraceae bacterium]|nr:YihY/virulence factor BrkB family protein [Egibacteraceae bacterium]